MAKKKRPPALSGLARSAQEFIDDRARLYEELRDPFRAWEAYWLARNAQGAGVEMPAWVTDYLARVARHMTALSIAISERSMPPGTLAEALELDGHGGGAVTSRRATLQRHQQYVVDVIEIMAQGYTQSKAIDACWTCSTRKTAAKTGGRSSAPSARTSGKAGASPAAAAGGCPFFHRRRPGKLRPLNLPWQISGL